MYGFISEFSILFYQSLCLSYASPARVLITVALQQAVTLGNVGPPTFFIFKVALAIQGHLQSYKY